MEREPGSGPASPGGAGGSPANAAAATTAPAPGPAPVRTHEVVVKLYEKRKQIYPRARVGPTMGRFARWRWALVWLTQVVFYGTPWLTWNGGQAVLLDILHRKFVFFDLVLWPQDVIYLTGVLVISALSLFLFTAVGGRLWCGYACPQTVYTEIFLWIERLFEGDRSSRIALDRRAMSAGKFARKAGKHLAWALLAGWTGFTFVGFFTPIREVGDAVLTLSTGPWETFWILFYGFATYGNAGWLREQVCLYMCPYARFQSAMFDRDTLIVTYDDARGEPRGPGRKGVDRGGEGLGDCIDCGYCVQVCPTGIDIRKGLQYECIGCAACIDACDHVMRKAGLPVGLVRYTTRTALAQGLASGQIWRRVFRLRVLLYGAVLGGIAAALVVSLSLRVPLKVDIIRDRGSFAREAEDGSVENVYRLQVMNTSASAHQYHLKAQGLPGIAVASEDRFEVAAASSRVIPVRLRAAPDTPPGSHRVAVEVEAGDAPQIHVRESTVFFGLR